MTHTHREFNAEHIPLAYLITFRCYGTWLHGDPRGSVDRFNNRFGTPMIPANEPWRKYNLALLKRPAVRLGARRRRAIETAIQQTCKARKWSLWALNARTNHIHAVVSGNCKPEKILSTLKAKATRKMREAGCWQSNETPWVRRGSKRYLWNERQVAAAVAYVMYDQGEPLPSAPNEPRAPASGST